ncbi:hypothetical protein L249_7651, partial [Ophiocordyceps polyrhachis-furcata BCC 54312]
MDFIYEASNVYNNIYDIIIIIIIIIIIMKAVFAFVTVLAGMAVASPGAESIKRQCLPNGSACRADGSMGNCCSGYCSQAAGAPLVSDEELMARKRREQNMSNHDDSLTYGTGISCMYPSVICYNRSGITLVAESSLHT